MFFKNLSLKITLFSLLFITLLFSQSIIFSEPAFAQSPIDDSVNIKDLLNIPNEQGKGTIKYSYFDPEKEPGCTGISPIACFGVRTIKYLSGVIGTVCFVIIIIGGLIMITSQGNETQVGKGKEILTNALIGLVIALSAYIITLFIQSIFYPS